MHIIITLLMIIISFSDLLHLVILSLQIVFYMSPEYLIQSFSELEIDAMCCVWPDERGYLYIYRCCGASGGGWGWKHDGYRHVQILLCMDISTIIKILNNFLGPLGFFLRVGILFI